MLFEPPYAQTIHYSQIPDLPTENPLHGELQAYRREMPRLLAAGLEGRWVLIQGGVVLGDFATMAAADDAGLTCFGMSSFLVKRVLEHEPVYRTPLSRVA